MHGLPNEYADAMRRSCTGLSNAFVCLVLVAAGCSSTMQRDDKRADQSGAGATRLPNIAGTEWSCIELIGPDGASVPVTDQPPTIVIATAGKASGFAGVNRYFSEVTFGNSITNVTPIRFGPVGATRMAGPPERMQLEGAFTSMLERVQSAKVVTGSGTSAAGPTLVLSDGERVLARFTPGAPSP